MTNVARLSSIGTCFAFEFDDYTNTTFSMSGLSTVFASEFDENTADPPTLSGNQRMSATSTGGVIVLDSINEIDPFEDITETNLELHLDSFDSTFSTITDATGQQLFTSNGTFTVPSGVTSIAIVCIGAGGGGGGSDQDDELGGGGGGGALAYVNNITTTPGQSLTVTVGTGGNNGGSKQDGSAGGNSSVVLGGTTLCSAGGGQGGAIVDNGGAGGAGGTVITGTGGSGGSGGNAINGTTGNGGGGGGAGGYSGNGGNGVANNSTATGGNGAGGAAGGAGRNAGGGGVDVLGEGTSGTGGAAGDGGGGGSGGDDGGSGATGGVGGLYGGGGAGASGADGAGSDAGANGAVRIIWGTGRSFPSTLTTDQTPGTLPVWEDLTANSRDLILLDGADKVGNFVNFDGVDDCGIIDGRSGNSYNGVTGTSARTSIIIFRIDTPNTDYKPLAWGDTVANGQKWTTAINSSNLVRGEVFGAAIEQPTTHRDNVVNVTDGRWHMVAISAPASGTVNDMRMWIDGVEVTGLTVTNGATSIDTANTNNLSVGASLADAAPQFLDGEIEKVMVYSRVLEDLEIKHIYQSVLNRLV